MLKKMLAQCTKAYFNVMRPLFQLSTITQKQPTKCVSLPFIGSLRVYNISKQKKCLRIAKLNDKDVFLLR